MPDINFINEYFTRQQKQISKFSKRFMNLKFYIKIYSKTDNLNNKFNLPLLNDLYINPFITIKNIHYYYPALWNNQSEEFIKMSIIELNNIAYFNNKITFYSKSSNLLKKYFAKNNLYFSFLDIIQIITDFEYLDRINNLYNNIDKNYNIFFDSIEEIDGKFVIYWHS